MKTYVDFVRLVSCESCDDPLPPASLQNGDLLGYPRVPSKWWEGEGGTLVRRSDEGRAFKHIVSICDFVSYQPMQHVSVPNIQQRAANSMPGLGCRGEM
jgi:hypothetical protein